MPFLCPALISEVEALHIWRDSMPASTCRQAGLALRGPTFAQPRPTCAKGSALADSPIRRPALEIRASWGFRTMGPTVDEWRKDCGQLSRSLGHSSLLYLRISVYPFPHAHRATVIDQPADDPTYQCMNRCPYVYYMDNAWRPPRIGKKTNTSQYNKALTSNEITRRSSMHSNSTMSD